MHSDLSIDETSLWHWLLRMLGHVPIRGVKGVVTKLASKRKSSRRRFCVQFEGLSYTGYLDQYIDQNIFYFGSYSRCELNFLELASSVLGRSRGPVTFADIGANVGQHSLFMSSRVAKIFSFEPSAECADQFEENVLRNGLLNVQIFRYALGDADGEAVLGSGLDGNNGSRSLTWTKDRSKDTVVRVRHAGAAMKELGVNRIDLIKIDVEGYESKVLKGLESVLYRDRPILLFELVGKDLKGGFRSEEELRSALYPDHLLLSLGGWRKAQLRAFDWGAEEAVCLPKELVANFASVVRQGQR